MKQSSAKIKLEVAAGKHAAVASEELYAAEVAAEAAGFIGTAQAFRELRAQINQAIQRMP